MRCFSGYAGGPGGAEALAEVRRQIARGQERIRKRKQVKAWLKSLGVSLDQVRDAEDALFLAHDRLQAR
jgi:DNA-binding PadR family transcriptional regulator